MIADAFDHTDIQIGQMNDGKTKKLEPALMLIVIWILLFMRVCFETMMKML